MSRALGALGGSLIAIAIAISTLGFLSQAMLSYPRVAFAMAEDGLLPGVFARLGTRSRAPVAAIALLGALISTTVLLGTYEQILSYVVVMDWRFLGLSAGGLLVVRARAPRPRAAAPKSGYRGPGHPCTTGVFVAVA